MSLVQTFYVAGAPGTVASQLIVLAAVLVLIPLGVLALRDAARWAADAPVEARWLAGLLADWLVCWLAGVLYRPSSGWCPFRPFVWMVSFSSLACSFAGLLPGLLAGLLGWLAFAGLLVSALLGSHAVQRYLFF